MAAINKSFFFLCFFFLSFALVIASDTAGTDQDEVQLDAYWKQRAEEAEQEAMQSFETNPELVTEEFNSNVGE